MGISPPPPTIAIRTEGEVSATASVSVEGHAAEIIVWGKLVFALGLEGQLNLVGTPELPGQNGGVFDPYELDPGSARKIVVRGARSLGGRIILRRGATALAEMAFVPGNETVTASLANTMQTTIAGRRGDEWLVVEGVDSPTARRWCKLPKLGVMATWHDPSAQGGPTSIPAFERLLLTSRLCFVDVSTWTISFVMRGARKVLARMAPTAVTVAIQDLGDESMPGGMLGRRVPLPPSNPMPVPAVSKQSVPGMPAIPSARAYDFDSGPTVMSRKDPPAPPKVVDDESTTGMVLSTDDLLDATVSDGAPRMTDEVSRAFDALVAPPEEAAKPRREESTLLSAFNPKESPIVKKRPTSG